MSVMAAVVPVMPAMVTSVVVPMPMVAVMVAAMMAVMPAVSVVPIGRAGDGRREHG